VKRAQPSPIDLAPYAAAIPLLVRNPSIVVVPLLMAVIGVLLGVVMTPGGGSGIGVATAGLAGLIEFLLTLFGLGAACIIADDAWRHGQASFDRGWTEAQRRGGEIFMASIGFGLLVTVGTYVAAWFGPIGLLLTVVIITFLIWTIPAAAVGGIPGGAAIQVSIDRVRANPLAAVPATIVSIALLVFAVPYATAALGGMLLQYSFGSTLLYRLAGALLQAIAMGYIALVITKTYTDTAFGARRW
jgi:hypothetical protein